MRDTIYVRTRAALVGEIAPQLRTINPRYAERVPLDNAALLARRVYASDLDVFDSDLREARDAISSARSDASSGSRRRSEGAVRCVEAMGCAPD